MELQSPPPRVRFRLRLSPNNMKAVGEGLITARWVLEK